MLEITDIQIEHLSDGCITDRRPNIRFSLASDRAGEALHKATISCGGWQIETKD